MNDSNCCFIFSNQMEFLAQALHTALFAPATHPFQKRIIVVPSPAVKTWLMQTIAKEKGIAAGLQFCFLQQAVQTLSDTFFSRSKYLPSRLEIELKLHAIIRQKIVQIELLSSAEQTLLEPLRKYLDCERKVDKSRERLFALVKQIGQAFISYGIYGGDWIRQWSYSTAKEWQQLLWQELLGTQSSWTCPQNLLQDATLKEGVDASNTEIHLFGLSFLSPLHMRFFLNLSHKVPVYGYLLSPSIYFWSDATSDRQRIYLQKLWQKRHVAAAVVDQMEDLLRDTNPLLLNLGRPGRKLFAFIEETQIQTVEKYVLPATIENNPAYTEILCDANLPQPQEPQELTLLAALQTDLLFLRSTAQETAPLTFDCYDQSVQIHAAPSRLREVQILHSNLVHLLHQSRLEESSLTPRDIIVMSPHIEDYIPYIEAVFETENPSIPYHIIDPNSANSSSLVKSLLCLFDLSSSRWDAVSVFKFLEQPAVARRFEWQAKELQQLARWIEQAGIRWGEDFSHRNTMLKKAMCRHDMLETSSLATWEHGLRKLLLSLCVDTSHLQDQVMSIDPELSPSSRIDFTQAPLLGKFIEVLHSLRHDLIPLQDGSLRLLVEWVLYIEHLLVSYFAIDPADVKETKEWQQLQQALVQLRKAAAEVPEEQYDFAFVSFQLQQQLQETEMEWSDNRLQTVRCSSLFPMRSVPAKVIYLLGMDKDHYPRAERNQALNLLRKASPQQTELPASQIEQDRYIFLETLLSARKYFIASYVHYSCDDYKSQPPCSMLHELLSYLKQAVQIEGQDGATRCTFYHPEHSFDLSYFLPQCKIPYECLSENQHHAAQAALQESRLLHRRLPQYFDLQQAVAQTLDLSALPPGCIDIELRHLLLAASDPLRLYCNRKLGLFLSPLQHQLKEEEEFYLSTLQFTILKREALRLGTKKVLRKAEQAGHLPLGRFKQVMQHKLAREVAQLERNLLQLQVEPQALLSVELTPFHSQLMQETAQHWTAPALCFALTPQTSVRITGVLHDVTEQGVLLYGKEQQDNYFKAWPTLLVLRALDPLQQHWPSNLLFVQSGVSKLLHLEQEQAAFALQRYLHFYFLCLQQPVALLPQWIQPLIEGNTSELQKQLQQNLASGWGASYSPYIKWAFQEDDLPPAKLLVQMWQEVLQQTYSPLLQALQQPAPAPV